MKEINMEGWESPVKIIMDDMAVQTEQEVLKAIQHVGIDVNKEELIRALEYDRAQYKKGYSDAMKNAVPLDKLCTLLQEAEDTGMTFRCVFCKKAFPEWCSAKNGNAGWDREFVCPTWEELTRWMQDWVPEPPSGE